MSINIAVFKLEPHSQVNFTDSSQIQFKQEI